MPRLLLFLFALASALPAFGQKVDDLQGFRQFKFGSPITAAPKGSAPPRPSIGVPGLTVVVPVSALAEPTVFGHPVTEIWLFYWKDELFSVDVLLKAPAPGRDLAGTMANERAVYDLVVDTLAKSYGDPGTGNNPTEGIYSATWHGKSVLVAFTGSRKDDSLFDLTFTSRPRAEAARSEPKPAPPADPTKRKDGL